MRKPKQSRRNSRMTCSPFRFNEYLNQANNFIIWTINNNLEMTIDWSRMNSNTCLSSLDVINLFIARITITDIIDLDSTAIIIMILYYNGNMTFPREFTIASGILCFILHILAQVPF